MYLLERLNFQQRELDFTREESVAVTHARLRPGSARYLGAASRPSGQPEQIMTKAKTKTQLSTEDNGSLTEAATPAVSTKRPRGADRDGAAKAAPVAAGNSVSAATIVPTPKPPRQTKSALLRTRLSEPGGASLASLIALTGWQAHTLRAALSGLRKEGLSLTGVAMGTIQSMRSRPQDMRHRTRMDRPRCRSRKAQFPC